MRGRKFAAAVAGADHAAHAPSHSASSSHAGHELGHIHATGASHAPHARLSSEKAAPRSTTGSTETGREKGGKGEERTAGSAPTTAAAVQYGVNGVRAMR